jgi:ribosomal protein S18 acetylase RimI-like enzyme
MVRTAEAGDIERILELSSRLYSEDGDVPFDRTAARGGLQELVDSGELGVAFVSEEGGRVVAYLVLVWGFSLEFGGRDAFVDELYVVPDWRGRGTGSALIEAAEAACVKARAIAIHLAVERSNVGAYRLYRRLGFSGQEKLLMTKRLD